MRIVLIAPPVEPAQSSWAAAAERQLRNALPDATLERVSVSGSDSVLVSSADMISKVSQPCDVCIAAPIGSGDRLPGALDVTATALWRLAARFADIAGARLICCLETSPHRLFRSSDELRTLATSIFAARGVAYLDCASLFERWLKRDDLSLDQVFDPNHRLTQRAAEAVGTILTDLATGGFGHRAPHEDGTDDFDRDFPSARNVFADTIAFPLELHPGQAVTLPNASYICGVGGVFSGTTGTLKLAGKLDSTSIQLDPAPRGQARFIRINPPVYAHHPVRIGFVSGDPNAWLRLDDIILATGNPSATGRRIRGVLDRRPALRLPMPELDAALAVHGYSRVLDTLNAPA